MDKYSGSLAGIRASDLGIAVGESDADAQLQSTAVEELLCLSNGALLRATIATGGEDAGTIEWKAVAEQGTLAELRRVVAMSQMSSMLKDTARNERYRQAIQSAIASFKASTGRAPRVVDVGAGTGLLSMLAASAGAEHVTGIEQWPTMASIAQRVVAANEAAGTISRGSVTILPKRSFDVSVGPAGCDMSAKADLVVSEILDTALLGEGIIASLRHAYEKLSIVAADLKTPDGQPLPPACVPLKGRLIAQLVSSPLLASWNQTSSTELRPGAPLGRRDLTPVCKASPIAIPVHAAKLQPAPVPLTAPFTVCEIDFSPAGLAADNPVFTQPHVVSVKPEEGASAGTAADAVLFWWDCTLWGGSGGVPPVTYGTSVEAVAQQGWQDHWVQCVLPLPVPVAPSSTDGSWTVAASVSDLRVDFVVGQGGAQPWPTKRAHKLSVKAGKTPAEQPVVYLEPELCNCGLHRLTTHERRWMLTDAAWTAPLTSAVDELLARLPGGSEPNRVLCLGEGSVCAVAAASSTLSSAPLHIVAVESSQPAGVQAQALLDAAVAEREQKDGGGSIVSCSVACIPPTEPLLQSLPEWLAEASEEDEEADGPSAAAAELPLFHAIACEPYFVTMANAPLWTAAQLWHRFKALASHPSFFAAFNPDHGAQPAIMPLRAAVYAQSVSFTHLHDTHGTVGSVCGFDHAPFDEVESGYHRHAFTYPVWQYDYRSVGEPVRVLTLDFVSAGDTDAASLAAVAGLPLSNASVDGGVPLCANAVLLWVDYEVSAGKWVSTGPRPSTDGSGSLPTPWRQAVKFLPPEVMEAAAAGAGTQIERGLHLSVAMDAEGSGAWDIALQLRQ